MRMTQIIKKKDTRTIKSAQLTTRRFVDYISKPLLTAVVISFAMLWIIGYAIEGFAFSMNTRTTITGSILCAGMLFFCFLSLWLIRGVSKKPYQSRDVWLQMVNTSIKTCAYTIITSCVFVMLT